MPRNPAFAAQLQDAQPSVATLFVHGTADKLIPMQRSLDLRVAYKPSLVEEYIHEGAHMVNGTLVLTRQYTRSNDFLCICISKVSANSHAVFLPDAFSWYVW